MPDDLTRRLAAAPGTTPPDDAVAAAAERAGLLDVAYDVIETAIGPLLAAVTPEGVVRLAFADDEDRLLADLAARLSPRILRAPARVAPVAGQLEAYLDGRRTAFDMPLDWRLARPFQRVVLARTVAIPYGETATYATVAAAAGRPRAARAAGRALATNPLCVVVPCHRVVPAAGGVGGYAGGADVKRRLLALVGAGQ
jgi:methylated-DNA-[protein]-cysteine S-methyltransferase